MSPLLAAVVQVEAIAGGEMDSASGADVHGLWFRQWRRADPAEGDRLHDGRSPLPFTLSPLLGLRPAAPGAAPETIAPPPPAREPGPERMAVDRGARAWFRLTALEERLAARVEEAWLPGLPERVTLGGLAWRVLGWTADPREHPWAGRADPRALAEAHLLAPAPPAGWNVRLVTPTAFHGEQAHLPFPLPAPLVGSWLRRWQAYGPVDLPEEIVERARAGLAVSAYTLQTAPLRDARRTFIGCVGQMRLRALKMIPGERAAIDLLAAYAFYAGSGHHTGQGMGMTKVRAG